MCDWIEINKEQPEEGEEVLTFFKPTGIAIMKYTRLVKKFAWTGRDYFSGSSGFLTDNVTHWIRLPKEPVIEGGG